MTLAWFKVDDQLHSHPKARRAGLEAMGMWLLAGSHCMSYLTDGFVEEWFVQSWPNGAACAQRLVDHGLWLVVEGGWQFHDWEEFQPTREKVEAERAAAAERMRRVRTNKTPNVRPNKNGTNGGGSATPSPSPSPSPSPDPLLTKSVSLDVPRANKTDGQHKKSRPVDPRRICELVETVCDSVIDEPTALKLSTWVVAQSPGEVQHPHAYTERAIKNDPMKIIEWIDTEGKP